MSTPYHRTIDVLTELGRRERLSGKPLLERFPVNPGRSCIWQLNMRSVSPLSPIENGRADAPTSAPKRARKGKVIRETWIRKTALVTY